MNYIDNQIADLTKQIRYLSKVRLQFRKNKQRACPHQNVKRYAIIPRLRFDHLTSDKVVNSHVKTKCVCLDCGKRW